MTSVISLPEPLTAPLPSKAKIKLRRLIAQAMDSEAAVRSLIAARERLGEEVAGIRHQSRQARQRAEALNLNVEEAVAEFAPLIAELEREIAHVDTQRAAREARRNDDAQLVAQVRDWLAHLPEGTTLASASRAAKPNDDETPAQAVARIRNQILARQQELRLLHAAPLPTAELKEKARAFVAELAAAGTPSLYVDQGRFEPRWMPGAWATSGTMAPAGAALIAWLFPDAMVAAMDALIDGIGSTSGMSASERPRREAALLGVIANLEQDEEALIERASEDGVEIGRRPLASPFAVLGVVESVAQRAAS